MVPSLFDYRSLPPDHRLFVEQLVNHLDQNQGVLVADDLNLRIRQFNLWKRVSDQIGLSKSLTPVEKEELRQVYMQRIIVKGEEVEVRSF